MRNSRGQPIATLRHGAFAAVARGGLRVVLAVVFLLPPISALGAGLFNLDPFAVGHASKNVKKAVKRVDKTVNALPEKLKEAVGANIKLASRETESLLSKVDDETVPLLNESVKTELNHVADLTNSLADQLNEISKRRVTQIDQATAARLQQTQAMIHDSVEQAQGMIADDIVLARNSVVVVEKQADTLVAKLINRTLYDSIRFTSLFLLLVGLLIVGLRVFSFVEKGHSVSSFLSKSFTFLLLGFGLISIFLGATVYLSIQPQTLAALSARVHFLQDEHSCQRLATQKSHLQKVKEIGDEGLTTATVSRVDESIRDCYSQ